MIPVAVTVDVVHHQVGLQVERYRLPVIAAGDGHLYPDGAQVVPHVREVPHLRIVEEGQNIGIVRAQAFHYGQVGCSLPLARGPVAVQPVKFGDVRGRHAIVAADPEEAAFVDDLAHRDHGVIAVAQPGVFVHARVEVVGILLLQLDDARIVVRDGLRAVVDLLPVAHAVPDLELAMDEQVEVDVDAVFLELRDEIVEAVEAFVGEVLGVVVGIVEDVRFRPVRVHVVQAHHVAAEARQARRRPLGRLVIHKHGAAGDHCAPETNRRAVLEDEAIAVDGEEAVLTRRRVQQVGGVHQRGHAVVHAQRLERVPATDVGRRRGCRAADLQLGVELDDKGEIAQDAHFAAQEGALSRQFAVQDSEPVRGGGFDYRGRTVNLANARGDPAVRQAHMPHAPALARQPQDDGAASTLRVSDRPLGGKGLEPGCNLLMHSVRLLRARAAGDGAQHRAEQPKSDYVPSDFAHPLAKRREPPGPGARAASVVTQRGPRIIEVPELREYSRNFANAERTR
jgi:hypothetical protein